MTVHNAFPQVLAGVTAESHSPKYGHFHNPPYCIQNHAENASPQVLTEFRINQRHGGIGFRNVLAVPGPTVRGARFRDAGWRGAARKEIRCLPRGVNLEDRTKRLAPFGDHARCQTARNGKLEDWVSGPSVPQRTFQLSGFDHMLLLEERGPG